MIARAGVILMDGLRLAAAGRLGSEMIGFLMGGFYFCPSGYVYGQWVRLAPGCRRARRHYTAQVFPPFVSYLTGWMMLRRNFIVCPWEAQLALGGSFGVSYIFPGQLDTWSFTRGWAARFSLPGCLRMALTLFLSYLNLPRISGERGLFQELATSSVLVDVLFCWSFYKRANGGSPANFQAARSAIRRWCRSY